MATDFKAIQQADYRAFLEKNVRTSGRELGEIRPAIINTASFETNATFRSFRRYLGQVTDNYQWVTKICRQRIETSHSFQNSLQRSVTTAEGSSLVKLGHMTVICGIKAEITTPKLEEPNKGFIVPNVELPPLCSVSFKQGPPTEQAQSASKFIDNVLINSKCVNRNDLCIEEGKMCWVLYCDMICLNHDGNLLSACTMALLAALRTVQLPHVEPCERTGTPKVDLEKRHPLAVCTHPVATSFAVFDDDIIVVDPTREEESLATGLFTIVTMESEEVCSIYKPGGSSLDKNRLQDCVTRSHVHAKEVHKLIEETINAVDR